MNNPKEIVKKALLSRKIREAFEKYPNKSKVLIVFGEGENKIYWQAKKNGDGTLTITEVKTNKSSFSLNEALPGDVSNSEYANAVKQATDALIAMDTGKIRMALNHLGQQVKNPKNNKFQMDTLGALNGALTKLQNELSDPNRPAGKGIEKPLTRTTAPTPAAPAIQGAPPSINAGKVVKGKMVKEAEVDQSKLPDDKKDKKVVDKAKKIAPAQPKNPPKPGKVPAEPVDSAKGEPEDISIKQDMPEEPVATPDVKTDDEKDQTPAMDVEPEGNETTSAIGDVLSNGVKSASIQFNKKTNTGTLIMVPQDGGESGIVKLRWNGKSRLTIGNKPYVVS